MLNDFFTKGNERMRKKFLICIIPIVFIIGIIVIVMNNINGMVILTINFAILSNDVLFNIFNLTETTPIKYKNKNKHN